MTALVRICAVQRCSNSLVDDYRHLSQSHQRRVLAPRAPLAARVRRRKATFPSPPFLITKRRWQLDSSSFVKLVERHLNQASRAEVSPGTSEADGPTLPTQGSSTKSFASTVKEAPRKLQLTSVPELAPVPPSQRRKISARCADARESMASATNSDEKAMPPPPLPAGDALTPTARRTHAKSYSITSRATNRLSLTLPVALPPSDASRIVPSPSIGTPSVPATPVEKPPVSSPSDANEFIIAIAAQERKVLELREELARAEAELTSLKKNWASRGTSRDTLHRRAGSRYAEMAKASTPATDGDMNDDAATRRSVDVDRRKLLLTTQATPTTPGTPGTPTQGRRRVLRGGHTRTLSLLSPVRSQPEFSVLDERSVNTTEESLSSSSSSTSTDQVPETPVNPALAKRMSWQPRSQHSYHNSPVPQIVEDFKLGFKAFVEDIRQIAVGDEPINGPSPSATRANRHSVSCHAEAVKLTPSPLGLPAPPRSRASPAVCPTSRMGSDPDRKEPAAEGAKQAAGKGKPFAWTPLGIESVDDTDWANWASPTTVKTSRWSGSTMNSCGEEIQSIPEQTEEQTTPRYVSNDGIGWRKDGH